MTDIYREFIMEIYKNPLNFGKITKPDVSASSGNPSCGDNVEITARLDSEGRISEIKFNGKGCAISQVSASLFTEALKGKTLEDAKKMKKEDVLELLKIDLGKNPTRMKCALLPLDVVKKL